MRPSRHPLAALILAGCTALAPLQAQQIPPPNPAIDFVPDDPWVWPLWPLPYGWLVGGTGYTFGHTPPIGITPALGLSALLVPSRTIGTWLGLPGVLPEPPVLLPEPFPLWMAKPVRPDGETSSASTEDGSLLPMPEPPTPIVMLMRWTRLGMTPLPAPIRKDWPDWPWLMSPWGPVALRPGPFAEIPAPGLPLGFPAAGGTPAAFITYLGMVRRVSGQVEVILFDYVTRTLLRPVTDATFPAITNISTASGLFALDVIQDGRASIVVFDMLTNSYDPLPEISGRIDSNSLSHRGEFIVYQNETPEGLQVHLFDRRQRVIDRLARLNQGGGAFDPNVDDLARWIIFTREIDGQLDLQLYDTTTGLVDTLPEINTAANEFSGNLSSDGRWFVYLTDADGRQEARVFDRATRSVDPLPELNSLGPILAATITGGDYFIFARVGEAPTTRAVLYVRTTGIIDPLPEVNGPDIEIISI